MALAFFFLSLFSVSFGQKSQQYQKLSLEEAKALILNKSFSESDKIQEFTELNDKDCWKKMHTQLYMVATDRILFYAITDRRVEALGGHYSYDLNRVVCDLDNDGNYELIYSFQFGSGVSVGILGIYSPGDKIDIDKSCEYAEKSLVSSYTFDKINDQKVKMQLKHYNKVVKEGYFLLDSTNKGKMLKVLE